MEKNDEDSRNVFTEHTGIRNTIDSDTCDPVSSDIDYETHGNLNTAGNAGQIQINSGESENIYSDAQPLDTFIETFTINQATRTSQTLADESNSDGGIKNVVMCAETQSEAENQSESDLSLSQEQKRNSDSGSVLVQSDKFLELAPSPEVISEDKSQIFESGNRNAEVVTCDARDETASVEDERNDQVSAHETSPLPTRVPSSEDSEFPSATPEPYETPQDTPIRDVDSNVASVSSEELDIREFHVLPIEEIGEPLLLAEELVTSRVTCSEDNAVELDNKDSADDRTTETLCESEDARESDAIIVVNNATGGGEITGCANTSSCNNLSASGDVEGESDVIRDSINAARDENVLTCGNALKASDKLEGSEDELTEVTNDVEDYKVPAGTDLIFRDDLLQRETMATQAMNIVIPPNEMKSNLKMSADHDIKHSNGTEFESSDEVMADVRVCTMDSVKVDINVTKENDVAESDDEIVTEGMATDVDVTMIEEDTQNTTITVSVHENQKNTSDERTPPLLSPTTEISIDVSNHQTPCSSNTTTVSVNGHMAIVSPQGNSTTITHVKPASPDITVAPVEQVKIDISDHLSSSSDGSNWSVECQADELGASLSSYHIISKFGKLDLTCDDKKPREFNVADASNKHQIRLNSNDDRTSMISSGRGGNLTSLDAIKVDLHGAWFCPYTQQVRIYLLESGIDFDFVPFDPYTKGNWYSHSQRGTQPYVKHNLKTFTGTLACVEYLESLHPNKKSLVHESHESISCRYWYDYIESRLADRLYTLLLSLDVGEKRTLREDLLTTLLNLSQAMDDGGPFVLGKEFGILDILLIPFATRLASLHLVKNFYIPSCGQFSRFQRWLDAVWQRQSVRQTAPNPSTILGANIARMRVKISPYT